MRTDPATATASLRLLASLSLACLASIHWVSLSHSLQQQYWRETCLSLVPVPVCRPNPTVAAAAAARTCSSLPHSLAHDLACDCRCSQLGAVRVAAAADASAPSQLTRTHLPCFSLAIAGADAGMCLLCIVRHASATNRAFAKLLRLTCEAVSVASTQSALGCALTTPNTTLPLPSSCYGT